MAEVTIHFLVRDDAGPIKSGSEGVADPHENLKKAGIDVSAKKLRFACDKTGKAVQNYYHRGTGEVQRVNGSQDKFLVTCPKCLASDQFKQALEAFDASINPAILMDADGNCCG